MVYAAVKKWFTWHNTPGFKTPKIRYLPGDRAYSIECFIIFSSLPYGEISLSLPVNSSHNVILHEVVHIVAW